MNEDPKEQHSMHNSGKGADTNKRRLGMPTIGRKHVIILLVGLLILACGIGLAVYILRGDKLSDRIIIGDTVITKEDIQNYVLDYKFEVATNPGIKTTDDNGNEINPEEKALNELVLNAAYKHEAKQLGKKLERADLVEVLGEDRDSNMNVDEYLKGYVARISIENRAYDQLLGEELLKKKDLLLISVIFDTPYFNQASSEKVQSYYDQAKARLQNEVLPLVRANKTKEEIAQKADTVWFDEDKADDRDWEQFFNKAVLTADIETDYRQGESTFNDMEDNYYLRGNVGKLFDTDDKIAELNKKGDYTDVFAAKSGGYMVIRLEDISEGKYGSWNEMLRHYKKTYVEGKFDIAVETIKSTVSSVARQTVLAVSSVGLQKAQAQAPNCSGHYVKFHMRAIDMRTGEELNGAQVVQTRGSHNCGSQFTGARTITSGGRPIPDNCMGPEPDWSAGGAAPNNDKSNDRVTRHANNMSDNEYLGLYSGSVSLNPGSASMERGFPDWVAAKINQRDEGIAIEARYRTERQEKSWDLNPRSYVSTYDSGNADYLDYGWSTGTIFAKPGDEVYFRHRVRNAGPATAEDFTRWRTSYTEAPNGTRLYTSGREGQTTTASLAADSNIHTPRDKYNAGGYQRAFRIPANAPAGTKYCQIYSVQPSAKEQNGSINNSIESSYQACVEVYYWDLVPQSSASSTYVEQGRSVNFDHSVYNQGNAWAIYYTPGGNTYIKNWPVFNYDPSNPSTPPGGYRLGPEASTWNSNFIAGGETREFEWTQISTTYPPPAIPGQTLTAPTGIGSLGDNYCQRLRVLPYSNMALGSLRDSSPACAKVVGGKTAVGVTAEPRYVEPTEAATMTVNLSTTNFTAQPPAWTGYNVGCTYTLTTTRYGGGTTTSNGSCSRTITSNDTVDVNVTPDTNLPVGSRVCIRAQLTSAAGPSGQHNPSLLRSPTSAEDQCIHIVAKPYFKSYGADIAAGQSFGGTCNDQASVIGWNKNAGPAYAGAGNQFAIYAYNQIRYTATAQGLADGSGYPNAPEGLSFANTPTTGSGAVAEPSPYSTGHYGGSFSGLGCTMTNYGTAPDDAEPWSSLADASKGIEVNRNFTHTGNLRLYGSNGESGDTANVVANGKNIKLYVEGDVFIEGNITAASGANSPAQIPVFTLVASGNIYLSPNVSSLYGTYVARGSGNTGNIYTCANRTGATTFMSLDARTTPAAYEACISQLNVTGSFVADEIHLLRTHGTLIQDNGDRNINGVGRTAAAEVFRYNPLIWLRQSTAEPAEGRTMTFDAITTLPPVL